jgi:superfamily II DNA/RNA helicase
MRAGVRELAKDHTFVELRNRRWLVEPMTSSRLGVSLTCIDDDAAGQSLTVLLDAEIGTDDAIDEDRWNKIASQGCDDPAEFRALIRSIAWRTSTAANRKLFQAPFRAGIRMSTYQLLPLKKALQLPRVNLLIADDVGLGKTIEAGLIVRELLLRGKIDFILVAAPPSMTIQWQEELEAKFGLGFSIIDRAYIADLRRQHGFGVNPWMTGSRFIISHRLLVEESYVSGLREGVLGEFRPRGLLILDEAHHAAPATGQKYAIDSQFTKAVDDLAQRFEHRLFLSATPHNGHSNSFSRLLEMLDPQRFTRGVKVKPSELEPVMVRRLKSDLIETGEPFPRRIVEPILLPQTPEQAPELVLASMLADYGELRKERIVSLPPRERALAAIIFVGLQQRLLSSVKAFTRTLEAHRRSMARLVDADGIAPPEAGNASSGLLDFVRQGVEGYEEQGANPGAADPDAEDTSAEEVLAEAATQSASQDATRDQLLSELKRVDAMLQLAQMIKDRPDARAVWLVNWIRENLLEGRVWNRRRLILFTEWEDTRRWVQTLLNREFANTEAADGRIGAFTGATTQDRREYLKHAFNADPDKEPLRILVCTDAAREGINLQMRCADLIHLDLPWNPSRIEQRNGRIDRKLQPAPEVRCRYFVYEQRPEDIVLNALVQKMETIRTQLGATGQVLEERIHDRLASEGIRRADAAGQAESILIEADGDRQKRASEEMDDETSARRARVKRDLESLRIELDRSREVAGVDASELMKVTSIALRRMSIDLEASKRIKGQDISVYQLDPDADAFATDQSWAQAFDDIRTRRRKKGERREDWRRAAPVRSLSFVPPVDVGGADIDDVAQLHLEHRLVRRLLSQFLSHGYQSSLNRSTVILSSASQPRVILLGRLILFGPGATKLHSELLPVTATWTDLDRTKKPLRILKRAGEAATLRELEVGLERGRQPTSSIIARLTAATENDVIDLRPALQALAADIVERETASLIEIGKIESKSLRALLEAQRTRILAAKKEADETAKQGDLFDGDRADRKQWELDRRHWVAKLARIETDLEIEPKRIIEAYSVLAHRLEPIGVVYLWPETN